MAARLTAQPSSQAAGRPSFGKAAPFLLVASSLAPSVPPPYDLPMLIAPLLVAPVVTVAVAVLALVEVVVRWRRLADYPLFRRLDPVGYEPAPGQGLMRGQFRWAFNSLGLRMDHDRPADADSVLLVGDSVVEPGAHVDQADTLGAHLQELCGASVYPAGSGGWALGNELAFLSARPQLLAAGTVVWVINSGDLVPANVWGGWLAHPLHRPLVHSFYVAARIGERLRARLFNRLFALRVESADPSLPGAMAAFLPRLAGRRVFFVLYPTLAEVARGERPLADLRDLVSGAGTVVEVSSAPGWSVDCYADGIHPNARGRALLARIIADALAAG